MLEVREANTKGMKLSRNKIISLLLEKGASINSEDTYGRTALWHTASNKSEHKNSLFIKIALNTLS